MRTIAVGLWIAWTTIALDMTLLPPTQLAWELEVTEKTLNDLKGSDPKFLEIPEVKEQIAYFERMLADPSTRSFSLWLRWIGLLLLVGLGLFAGYATFRQRPYAVALILTSSLLFLLRQAVFNRAVYELLLDGSNPIPWLLKNGHFQMAFSSIWFDFVLGIFFVFLTIFALIHIVRARFREKSETI